MLGFSVANLVAGSYVIEVVFSWPGMAQFGFEAILDRDYPVIMGVTLFSSIFIIVGNLLADLAYIVINPRVATPGGAADGHCSCAPGRAYVATHEQRAIAVPARVGSVLPEQVGDCWASSFCSSWGSRHSLHPGLRRTIPMPSTCCRTRSVQPPSWAHPFGTDELGRDGLSRAIFGARISLAVGIIASLVAVTLGVLVGATAGMAGGWVDSFLMRSVDILLSVPLFFLVMISQIVFPPSIFTIMIIIGWSAGWTSPA